MLQYSEAFHLVMRGKSRMVGKYLSNITGWKVSQVEMYVIAGEDLALAHGITIAKGERILMEISRKFLTKQLRGLAYHSGFYFQVKFSCCSMTRNLPAAFMVKNKRKPVDKQAK